MKKIHYCVVWISIFGIHNEEIDICLVDSRTNACVFVCLWMGGCMHACIRECVLSCTNGDYVFYCACLQACMCVCVFISAYFSVCVCVCVYWYLTDR